MFKKIIGDGFKIVAGLLVIIGMVLAFSPDDTNPGLTEYLSPIRSFFAEFYKPLRMKNIKNQLNILIS